MTVLVTYDTPAQIETYYEFLYEAMIQAFAASHPVIRFAVQDYQKISRNTSPIDIAHDPVIILHNKFPVAKMLKKVGVSAEDALDLSQRVNDSLYGHFSDRTLQGFAVTDNDPQNIYRKDYAARIIREMGIPVAQTAPLSRRINGIKPPFFVKLVTADRSCKTGFGVHRIEHLSDFHAFYDMLQAQDGHSDAYYVIQEQIPGHLTTKVLVISGLVAGAVTMRKNGHLGSKRPEKLGPLRDYATCIGEYCAAHGNQIVSVDFVGGVAIADVNPFPSKRTVEFSLGLEENLESICEAGAQIAEAIDARRV